MDRRDENSRFSWLARQITTYIAGGYQIGKNEQNKPLEQAGMIAFDDIERLYLGGTVTSGSAAGVKENAPGSYERFMGTMARQGRAG